MRSMDSSLEYLERLKPSALEKVMKPKHPFRSLSFHRQPRALGVTDLNSFQSVSL